VTEKIMKKNRSKQLLTALALVATLGVGTLQAAGVTLLNVSYDPTREFYQDYNKIFIKHWAETSKETVEINQSHGGSGKQARAIIDGLDADVATLGLAYDVDQLYQKGKLIPENWQSRLPNNSSPYTSTIVFLVRKGNPQHIKDWDDLVKPGVALVSANPKTSGGARWNYLAAWGYALKKYGDEASARDFVKRFYKNVAVLDTGARGATVSFVERGIGDVLINWENEAYLNLKEYGSDKYEVIVPSISVLAEPPVTVVDTIVKRHGTEKVATEYLAYLYSKEAQELAAKHFYRPSDKEVLAKHASEFKPLNLFTVDQVFGGWTKAQNTHFADGGVFDQIFAQ